MSDNEPQTSKCIKKELCCLKSQKEQINYANVCASVGFRALGICARDGVVLATIRKPDTSLITMECGKNIVKITNFVGITYAGISSDFHVLADKAFYDEVSRSLHYRDSNNVIHSAKALSSVMQQFTKTKDVRPYGVNLLIGGLDMDLSEDGYREARPYLYQLMADGDITQVQAGAVGQGAELAIQYLDTRYRNTIIIRTAIKWALRSHLAATNCTANLYAKNLEIMVIDKSGFHPLSTKEIRKYMNEIMW